MLQNSFFAKKYQPQQSIKKLTPIQQTPAFVHSLSFSLNDQRLVICMSQLSEINSTLSKLTKVLPEPPLFIDRKNLSINHWLSKIQDKFKIN